MRNLILLLVFICTPSLCHAQYKEAARFTTADGLPSDHIYHCMEDNQGFLWVATDQGLARFDGKHFQLFTTEQGLPDNEVLEVVKEKNGRIWVSCFKQIPAYYDSLTNRFVISSKDSTGAPKIIGTSGGNLSALTDGGVEYRNNLGAFVFKNKQCTFYKNEHILKVNHDGTELIWHDNKSKDSAEIRLTLKGKLLDHFIMKGSLSYFIQPMADSSLYVSIGNHIKWLRISNIRYHPMRMDIDTLKLHSTMSRYSISSTHIIATTNEGNIDVYEKNSFTYLFTLHGDYKANRGYEDHNGNIWICTMDKGLIMYKVSGIKAYELPAPFNTNVYLSIACKKNGSLFLGGHTNEILEINQMRISKHILDFQSVDYWQRNIILSQDKVFACSGAGISVDFRTWLKIPFVENRFSSKAAIALNDSIILSGDMYGLYKINTIKEQITLLKDKRIRVTCIAARDRHQIYFGSTNGLHKYDMLTDSIYSFDKTYKLLSERIISLCFSSDSILWIASASNGIFAMKDDKVLLQLKMENGLNTNNNITITTGRNGQVWVGTNSGISIIYYRSIGNIKVDKIQNLSIHDGLTSNIINQMLFQNDTIYAATNRGVSIIPSSVNIPTFDIPVFLTGIQINQQHAYIQSHYELNSKQNFINLQFAGVELNGHFKNAQYSSDFGSTWTDLEGINLNLQLASGEHFIWLRAIDVNGNKGSKILKLQFDIATPFYKAWWFWVLIFLLLLATSFYLYTQWTKRKHQQKINEFLHQKELDELEIQALKAQINPHFVFNCLNSVRGFIYAEDFENADLYLQKFSQILRSTLKLSSLRSISLKEELEFIDTYLVLEKLRFGNKFEYLINMEEGISLEYIMIPAMLLQPFVENAINHGVDHLENRAGKILINVYLANDKLNITIDDNGIGRENAGKIKLLRDKTHESRGMELTQRRIELYHIEMDIIDKTDEQHVASGTTIHLEIPIPLL